MKLLLVAGARPNFMKIAPLIHELARDARGLTWRVVHTGQHYDYEMSKAFFEDFDLPAPDHFLGVGSGSHATQIAKTMVAFEEVCLAEHPDLTVVVGDVNATIACALTAKKLGIGVAHVEAGLRSGDMTMPEEINRIATDAIADYLFTTEPSAAAHLAHEGKRPAQVFFVGNVMIDALHYGLRKLKTAPLASPSEKGYAVVTLHRPSNVDDPAVLKGILSALGEIARDRKVYFPVHPRTRERLERFNLLPILEEARIAPLPPLGYLPFLALWTKAALVLTDSGGIQEETTALGTPCLTLRERTERPITIEEGTNVLAGTTTEGILAAYRRFAAGDTKAGRVPALWDGHAAARILAVLAGATRTSDRTRGKA